MTDGSRRPARLDPARLRAGEWLAGAAGLVLLADLFAVHWFGRGMVSLTGWSALSVLRWVLVVSGLAGLGLAVAQARYRAPAAPVTLAVVVTLLGLLATIAMLVRVLDPPGDLASRPGAGVALAAGVALFLAGLGSLRQEGILDRDGPGEIPTHAI